MNKHNFKRVFWLIAGILLVIALLVVYFNRSYAYIYNYIDKSALQSPDRNRFIKVVNNQTASTTLTYVALGDSLTAGVGADTYEETYPYLLADYFAGNNYIVDIRNRAVPGAKTGDLLNGLLPAAIKDDPDIVTLLIGVNDIHGQVDSQVFAANYEKILQRLKQETKAKIYIVSIPYIGASNLLLPPYNCIFNHRTREYNKIIAALALKYNLKYIDLYEQTEELFKHSGPHYAADFFHPSAQGYKIWADLIYDSISQ